MLLSFHFDREKIKMVKGDMITFYNGDVKKDDISSLKEKYIKFPRVPLLLLMHYLFVNDTELNVKQFDRFIYEIIGYHIEEQLEKVSSYHPVHELVVENHRFRNWLYRVNEGISMVESGWDKTIHAEMNDIMYSVGQLYNHFHVKEKLIFPVLERYGHSMFTREIWREDDRIRGLYHGAKNMINKIDFRKPEDVRLTFYTFEEAFQSMIFQEEKFLFPIVLELFKESEWNQIAVESSAYGYKMIKETEVQSQNWHMLNKAEKEREMGVKLNNILREKEMAELKLVSGNDVKTPIKRNPEAKESLSKPRNGVDSWKTENIPFGGGFLTLEEANLIFNHLPVEITFVDRNSIFKYFNQLTSAEDMMLIRTPLSIGRNVADCHPPKSLKKVMTLMRDLKAKKRETESMWFKKGDAYVHITYKALFNDDDEFIGVLEYVQDIAPFLNLPKEVKRELSPLEDEQ